MFMSLWVLTILPVRSKIYGLRGVECGEISGAACIVVKTCGKHCLAAFKVVIGVLQKAFGFRRHRSSPSRRISCMSGERSRYAPAG